ncbi:hypothetical protein GGI19_001083 [Coemansia pectinata]|uniref:RING-type E3 ubiquitin transferase n=1 Tax=Coemansia pectinata TaxID=1052879 RepID=A0A9W8H1X9_9FUNG|nr:hypothetical protein GGI19_001083 [Coemansia pectinata]
MDSSSDGPAANGAFNDNISETSSETSCDESEYLCPICLQHAIDQSYTDPCYHQFCFACILQWCELRARCPLCNSAIVALLQRHPDSDTITRTPIGNLLPSNLTASTFSAYRRRPYARTYGRDAVLEQADEQLGMRKRIAVYTHRLLRRLDLGANVSRRTRPSQVPSLLCVEIESARCRQWIARDLKAMLGTDDVEFIEALVVAMVKEAGSLDIEQMSGKDTIAGLLGPRVSQFFEELAGFVDSSLDMRNFDKYTVYDTRAQ